MELPYALTHACGVLREKLLSMASTQFDRADPASCGGHISTFPEAELLPKRNGVSIGEVVEAINGGLRELNYKTDFEIAGISLLPKAAKIQIREGHVIIAASNPQALLEDWERVTQRARTIARSGKGRDRHRG